ncbi:ferredoxin [Nocardia terpenica]|uniref:Ferredoxin n=1 Tax=Nocardia terpenica TaxID=455432 RepID=A0A6G9ZAF6_9NOCA|nr:ferredoxin [Nocardia terpenica]QIS22599.1 ferredoxin [Nocardia terpenica]
MRISVDRERCIGSGMCALTAPEIFDQDDDEGKVKLLDAQPQRSHAEVREAAVVCPSGAIEVEE